MKRRARHRAGPAPLDLIEEAVHLLRSAWPSTWLVYLLGTVPFVLGLLYFWTDMSRGAFADRRCLLSALGVALLFVWMRTCQAVFAVKLREQSSGHPPSRWRARRWWRVGLIQASIQPSELVMLPLSTVAFPWVFAFYQSVAVVAGGTQGRFTTTFNRAARLSRRWAWNNCVGLLILGTFGFVVFLNFIIGIVALPWLVKLLFGVDSAFTFSGLAVFNTTLLAVAAGLTYLAVDPLIRAVYVLRSYYGESLTTGEDLQVALRAFAKSARVVAAALGLLMVFSGTARTITAESPATTTATARDDHANLDRAFDRVLRRTEYNWRLPREQSPESATEQGWFAQRVTEIETALSDAFRWVGDKFSSVLDWLEKLLRPRGRMPNVSGNPLAWMASVRMLVFLSLIVAVCVLTVLLLRTWQRWVRSEVVSAEAIVAVPDLSDESVGADQLPEDGWLRMAREKMAQGELLLAMRAWYLASLAHLAHRELVRLEKFKSNRDYEREVQRRARARPGLPEAFAENVSAFDRAWYGLHEVTREGLAQFEQNFQHIKAS